MASQLTQSRDISPHPPLPTGTELQLVDEEDPPSQDTIVKLLTNQPSLPSSEAPSVSPLTHPSTEVRRCPYCENPHPLFQCQDTTAT